MSEHPAGQAAPNRREQIPLRPTSLRAQLIWSSVFPLGMFVLLVILVVMAAFRQLTLNLALQRDTARVQAAAG